MSNNATFIVSIVAIIMSVLSFVSACGCIIYVVGLRNSTHTVSWKPLFDKKEGEIPDVVAKAEDSEDDDIYEPPTF